MGVGSSGSVGHGARDEDGLTVLRGCSVLKDVAGWKLCAGQSLEEVKFKQDEPRGSRKSHIHKGTNLQGLCS